MVSVDDGQGRLPEFAPVGIVDIGSNSIRLVVYDASRRSPTSVYNEKILCGLGRGLAKTGVMDAGNIAHALETLGRFKALNRQLGVETVHAVATAAVREAENGPAFVAEAERALGAKVRVLSGKQEARLAAFGVLAGIPDADGLIGDLGGGSLELIQIQNGTPGIGITLPLGPLRLHDLANDNAEKTDILIAQALDKAKAQKVFEGLKNRNFYAVGGTWRNLARMRIAQVDYPLAVLHHYSMSRVQALDFAAGIASQTPDDLNNLNMISRKRAVNLPLGAAILERLLKLIPVNEVIVSAYGVREGQLFTKLKEKTRRDDPLIAASRDLARLRARSLRYADELCAWTDQLFAGGGPAETPAQRRLRHAACLMADIGWRASQDQRGEQSLNIIAHAAMGGVTHGDRAFLALTVYYRYARGHRTRFSKRLLALMDEQMIARARLIAGTQRLAYLLSGAFPGVLPDVSLRVGKTSVRLEIPKKHAALWGDKVGGHMKDLAAALKRKPECLIAGKPV